MIDEINVFFGSSKDFDQLLINHGVNSEEITSFVEVIQHYNARIRPSEAAVKEADLGTKITATICVVRSDDYASVLEHVLSNFVGIITRNYNIQRLFIHNPPKRVLRSLISSFGEESLCISASNYADVTRDSLSVVYTQINENVLGQEQCKKQIISGLYKATVSNRKKPIVLMLYGPSGVGKTETAKNISLALGGELLRIQFSMMQTTEAFDYIFGAEHSKDSFARDLQARESNVILIDEFDKVNPRFYNAFYELFDEGHFSDINYDVSLPNAIFLLTCNFLNDQDIKSALGPAMYSRIDSFVQYNDLSKEQKEEIVKRWYKDIIGELQADEREVIEKTNILQWFIDNAHRYDNIRILKTKMENAVFDRLAETFIIHPCNK